MDAKLTISKLVPATTNTLTAYWCSKNFMEMSPKYREIRAQTSDPMDSCYWCERKIADGEMMGLAAFSGRVGNKILCQKCADELLASQPPAS